MVVEVLELVEVVVLEVSEVVLVEVVVSVDRVEVEVVRAAVVDVVVSVLPPRSDVNVKNIDGTVGRPRIPFIVVRRN